MQRSTDPAGLTARMRVMVIIGLALGSLCALAIGATVLWFGRKDPALQVFGAMVFVGACFGLHLFARGALSRRPMLRIDSTGIDPIAFGPIAWQQVAAMSLHRMPLRYATRQKLLLYVREPGKYLRKSWVFRYLADSSELDAPIGVLMVDITSLDKEPQQILSFAESLRNRIEPRMPRFWLPNMSEEGVLRQGEMEALGDRARELLRSVKSGTPREQVEAFERARPELDALENRLEQLKATPVPTLPVPKPTSRDSRRLNAMILIAFAIMMWIVFASPRH